MRLLVFGLAALLSGCAFGLDFGEIEACPEGLVLVGAECACPPALFNDGGLFDIDGDPSTCEAELEHIDFLGDGGMTPQDADVVEVSPGLWEIAILTESAHAYEVSRYRVTRSGSDFEYETLAESGRLTNEKDPVGVGLIGPADALSAVVAFADGTVAELGLEGNPATVSPISFGAPESVPQRVAYATGWRPDPEGPSVLLAFVADANSEWRVAVVRKEGNGELSVQASVDDDLGFFSRLRPTSVGTYQCARDELIIQGVFESPEGVVVGGAWVTRVSTSSCDECLMNSAACDLDFHPTAAVTPALWVVGFDPAQGAPVAIEIGAGLGSNAELNALRSELEPMADTEDEVVGFVQTLVLPDGEDSLKSIAYPMVLQCATPVCATIRHRVMGGVRVEVSYDELAVRDVDAICVEDDFLDGCREANEDEGFQRIALFRPETLGDESRLILSVPADDRHVLGIIEGDRLEAQYVFDAPVVNDERGPKVFARGPLILVETSSGLRLLGVAAETP